MNSETVQAAQRLIAEWESSPRATPADWLETEIENCAHRLLQLVSVRAAMRSAPASALWGNAPLSSAAYLMAYVQPAPEDAERAAYLARWKHAPEWANWLCQCVGGACFWSKDREAPIRRGDEWWPIRAQDFAGHKLLGSVRCEPRPKPEGGQGVEG